MITTTKPLVRIDSCIDPEEMACCVVAACFKWVSDSVDADGSEHPQPDGEHAEFEQAHEEVDVDFSGYEGHGNEIGIPPTLIGEVEGTLINGNTSTIEVALRMIGFRRDGSQPVATYFVKDWKYV